jgi:hypothetical protein
MIQEYRIPATGRHSPGGIAGRRRVVDRGAMTTASLAPSTLSDRYISVWNEPDPDARRELIMSLWTPGGRAILELPQEARAKAYDLGIPYATFEIRGYDEIASRVGRAYEQFVAPGTHRFRIGDPGRRVGDLQTFGWDYVTVAGEEIQGSGTEIMHLAADGRIEVVYQLVR